MEPDMLICTCGTNMQVQGRNFVCPNPLCPSPKIVPIPIKIPTHAQLLVLYRTLWGLADETLKGDENAKERLKTFLDSEYL